MQRSIYYFLLIVLVTNLLFLIIFRCGIKSWKEMQSDMRSNARKIFTIFVPVTNVSILNTKVQILRKLHDQFKNEAQQIRTILYQFMSSIRYDKNNLTETNSLKCRIYIIFFFLKIYFGRI